MKEVYEGSMVFMSRISFSSLDLIWPRFMQLKEMTVWHSLLSWCLAAEQESVFLWFLSRSDLDYFYFDW